MKSLLVSVCFLLITVNTGFSQTITTGTVTTPKCAGTTFNLTYSKSGTFTAGNIFTAQLSNAAGSFTSSVNIGTLTSTLAGTIVCTIPPNTPSGTGYRVRVVSSAPARTGSINNSNITINALLTPEVTISSSASGSICSSTSATLTAVAVNGGTSPVYSWYKNGFSVGTNSNMYSGSIWNDKDSVYCVLTSNASCVTNTKDTSNLKVLDVENSNGSSWRKRNDIYYGNTNHEQAVSFSIGNKGYLCTGGAKTKDVYEYNPSDDVWLKKNDFPGSGRVNAVGFVIGNKGYMGTGNISGGGTNDFWEYNPDTDTWIQKSNYPGGLIDNLIGFSIGSKGYIAQGNNFWEYNPQTDIWTSKPTIPGNAERYSGFGFSIGGKGFVGGGYYYEQQFHPIFGWISIKRSCVDFWEYDPSNQSWTSRASISGFEETTSFVIGNKAYVGTGGGDYSSPSNNNFAEYDFFADSWSISSFPGQARYGAFGLSINNIGYIGGGRESYQIANTGEVIDTIYNDVWEFKNLLKIDSLTQAYCPGDNLLVNFNIGCFNFNNGNTFTLQISDKNGNFQNARIIGTSSSTSSGILNGVIPNGLTYGTNYKVRILASDPQYVSLEYPISIRPIVTPIIISGPYNAFGCSNSQLNYNVQFVNGATYNWTTGVGNSIVSGQGTNSATFNLINSGTISVVATLNNECGTTTASSNFTFINTIPSTPLFIKKSFNPEKAADFNITPYLQSNYNISNVADTFRVRKISSEKNYIWEAPSGSIVNNVDDTTIAVIFPDNLIILPSSPQFIKVYSKTECAISAPLIINLRRNFDYPIGSSDLSICSGQNVTLAASYDTSTTMMDADGNFYPIVKIGNQFWMAKNMAVNAPGSGFYFDDPQNGEIYGRLYSSSSGVAPQGWRIPSRNDMEMLSNYLGYINTGGKLKATGTEYWLDPNLDATNESGFTALPGGGYTMGGLNESGFWWLSDVNIIETHEGGYYSNIINFFSLNYQNGELMYNQAFEGGNALSIRCLRNAPALTYLWSNGATTRTISVNPTANTTYYCTISDGLGYVVDSFKVNVSPSIPSAPPTIYGSTDVCSSIASNSVSISVRYYVRKVNNATSYNWTVPTGATIISGQGDTAINVTFNSSFVSGVISVKSVNVCGSSTSSRTLTVYKRTAATPAAIQKEYSPVSIAAVTNVCGLSSSVYRIKKVTYATSYNWYFNIGSNANITHVNSPGVNDTAVIVTFLSGFRKDTLSVKSISACNSSTAKTVILNATLLPPAVTTINGKLTPCIGEVVNYSATAAAPTTTQTSIAVYRWTKPNNTTIVSAASDSSYINLQFNTGFTGGSITAKGQSACGIAGTAKSVSLQYLTPTPTSITSSTGVYNACIGTPVTYTAVLPAPTTTQRAANVYRWTKPNYTTILSASADSLSITLQFNVGYIGGSLSVKGQTACGITGTAKTQALTHSACPTGTKINPITINKNENNFNVTIYPNPTSTDFNLKVEASDIHKQVSIKIRDVEGRLLKTIYVMPQQNVSFGSDLIPGVYMLEATDGYNKKSIRAVKY